MMIIAQLFHVQYGDAIDRGTVRRSRSNLFIILAGTNEDIKQLFVLPDFCLLAFHRHELLCSMREVRWLHVSDSERTSVSAVKWN